MGNQTTRKNEKNEEAEDEMKWRRQFIFLAYTLHFDINNIPPTALRYTSDEENLN